MIRKRNVVFVSHAHAGKTTLAESALWVTKTTTRKGSVPDGNTVSDYSDEEKTHKVSITTSVLDCSYKGHLIQIIDTPGYADFVGEFVSAVKVADGAVVIVDATGGIEVGTERAWDRLNEKGIPRLIFINKLDKENTDVNTALQEIKKGLSKNAILIQEPLAGDTIETIAENDDALLEQYLEGKEIPQEVLKKTLKKAVLEGKVYPVFSGSAIKDEGVKELLDAIIEYLPSPAERPAIMTKIPDSEEEKQVELSESAPLCGFVFKSIADPYVGQLSVIKIFSGKLQANTGFYNVNKQSKERISQIYCLQGKEQRSIPEASCGDIIAIAKLKDTTTNDTIGPDGALGLFEPIKFPEPIFSASIKPKTRADEEKISTTLAKITAEDPTFTATHDAQTKELVISGMGDQHLNVMVERMKKRFNVSVDLGTPKVPYKETITKKAQVQNKYKKQSGGARPVCRRMD